MLDFHQVEVAGDLTVFYGRFEVGTVSAAALLSGKPLYMTQVREFIAPVGGLRERAGELEVLAGFCRGKRPYLWMRAEPWAGKTALLAWFALYPPPDVTVVSFFVTDRLADQNDHIAFTNAILDQLAVLLPDQRMLIATTTINRDGLRTELLAEAARREAAAGRRLVLVVDGLDEDAGTPPIVSLLPAQPEPGLRVIIASRHGPQLPIPPGHPLTSARPYLLTSSPFAAGMRGRAIAELDALLRGPAQHRELLALITAAKGLTGSELTELTEMAPFEIDALLCGVAGRSFRTFSAPAHADAERDPVYALAHETLQRTAEQRLGARQLEASLERLHGWARRYRDTGWPAETPDFLLRRYFPVLEGRHDLERMAALALDTARHDLMCMRTGGDWTALTEIRAVQQHICGQTDPDLLTTARLARHRDEIHDRNVFIPLPLLTLRVRLGQPDRAEALARSIFDLHKHDAALAQVAEAMVRTDPDRAETIARAISEPGRQAEAMARIANAVAETDPERAVQLADYVETLTRDIRYPASQAEALVRVIDAVAATDPDRAHRLADHAEALARTIRDLEGQAEALAGIANAVAETDPERAVQLADYVETLTRDIRHPASQAEALVWVIDAVAATDLERAIRLCDRAVALWGVLSGKETDPIIRVIEAVAGTDPDRAEALARRLHTSPKENALARVAGVVAGTDPDRAIALARSIFFDDFVRVDALVQVTTAVAETDRERALQLADHAGALASHIFFPEKQVDALARIINVIAGIDPDRALQLADRAEALARGVGLPQQPDALAGIADAIAETDPERALQLADRAEALARSLFSYSRRHSEALARIAQVVAETDSDRGEALARSIRSVLEQPYALARVAGVVAGTDPDRGEALARSISHQWAQPSGLAQVAMTVARSDPDRGEALARSISCASTVSNSYHDEALARIAQVVAETDPDRGEAIARSIFDPYRQADALAQVAGATARSHLDRGEAIARSISNPYQQADALAQVAGAAVRTDPHRADRLVGRAEALVRTVFDRNFHESALTRVAIAVAETDPDRAEAIARTVSDPDRQANVLAQVARVVTDTNPQPDGGADPGLSNSGSLPAVLSATPTAGPPSRRGKRLLALAWSAGGWAIPVRALAVVDAAVLNELVAETIGDEQ